MLLKILLLAQQALVVTSFNWRSVSYGFITASPHRMRQIQVLSTKADDSEFFSLGDVNTKSKIDRDTFLFGEKVSFASCGVGAELTAALEATGKFNPTSIQVKTFSAIAEGRDVIIGAETGSGKTLSYLLPLIQGLLDEETKNDDDDDELSLSMGSYPSAIIMVPNKELCSQVYRMANELISHIPQKDKVSIGLFTQVLDRWPYSRSQISPKIAVCTPAFLANFIRGPNILEENLFRSLRQLVLDEADMLLEGSYLGDVEKVVESFRLIRREMIREGQIDINDRVLQNILVAATLPSYGLRSIEKYIEKRFPLATRISNDHLHKHHPRIEQSFIKTRGDLLSRKRIDLVVRAIRGEDISVESDSVEEEEEEDEGNGDFNASDFMGSPEPDSDSDASPVVLVNDEDIVQTMIFVNTADTASRLAIELGKAGVRSAEYHKFVSDADKQESLRLFREEEVSVLVCTDHASRGLDLPNVRHVIQAEFAGNVVQYLHRIGRASRAGVLGKATNIYDDKSADLVTSILSDSEEKKIDQSFSRRRGFRQKIKKDFRRTTGWTPPERPNNSQY